MNGSNAAKRRRKLAATLWAMLAISGLALAISMLPEMLLLLYVGLTSAITLGTVLNAVHAYLPDSKVSSSPAESAVEQAEAIVRAAHRSSA